MLKILCNRTKRTNDDRLKTLYFMPYAILIKVEQDTRIDVVFDVKTSVFQYF